MEKNLSIEQIETQCKKMGCENYIEWGFGYGT